MAQDVRRLPELGAPRVQSQAPPQSPPPAAPDDARRLTLVEHLEELRRALIISMGAWAVTTVLGVILSGFVLSLIIRPLSYLHQPLHYFSPMGYFSIHLKVGLVVGLALALPIIAWQTWSFVSPGLRPAERRFAKPLLVSSLGLFAAGAALAYFFLFIAIRMVSLVNHDGSLVFFPEANAYIGFVLLLMVAFGVTFEFPVALVLLSMARLVDAARLKRSRKIAYFAIAGVGYLVTPGVDPVTPIALVTPLILLYEAAIVIITRIEKGRRVRESAEG
ncbi:MAG: twin-arginine translocase subunit TatC [Candidatus Dormibacteraeota bacterium]|nr:twin-arginine translocase subunit TatC [Candidatus Dormibacteraeota bacterium]